MKSEEIKKLASTLFFEIDDENINLLTKEFENFEEQVDLINEVDNLENTKPMHMIEYVDDIVLRQDIEKDKLSKKDILINSSDIFGDSIRIVKVVK